MIQNKDRADLLVTRFLVRGACQLFSRHFQVFTDLTETLACAHFRLQSQTIDNHWHSPSCTRVRAQAAEEISLRG